MNPAGRQVILVRHGETALNVEKRYRGRADPPMEQRGLEHARLLAAELALHGTFELLASPRLRTRQTAAPIADRFGVPCQVDPGVDDIDYGEWTACTVPEVRARWPDLYAAFQSRPEEVCFPGGESVSGLVARARAALETARETALTVIVTHDVLIRVLLCTVLGAPLASMHRVHVDLTSTTGLRLTPDGVHVEWVNDTRHLGPRQSAGGSAT